MRALLILLLLGGLLLPTLPAQIITVSEDITLRSDTDYQLIGKLGRKALLFQSRNNHFEVMAYDESMREAWSKEIELDRRSPKVIDILARPNDFVVVYNFRRKGHTYLKAHRYDPAANLRDSATIADLGFLFYSPDYEMVRSEDRSKLLVYYAEHNSTVHAYSFDLNTMQPLWQRSLKPDDFYFGENFLQAIVDNDGRMHLVIERDNFRSKRKQHLYEIISFAGEDAPLRTETIEMEDKLTYDVFFTYDNLNRQMVAGGLYSEKDHNRAQGFFYLRTRPAAGGTLVDSVLTFTRFSDELINSLEGEEKKNNKGLRELSVRETVLRRDGGILLIAESNRQYERRSTAANRVFYDSPARLLVDYYYDELMVFSLDPDGSLHWQNILHKKQYSQDDQGAYSSYFLLRTPTHLRFLFNDEIRYENTVSEYVLNGLGAYDRNSLFSTKNLDLRLRFRDALQVAGNELLIPSERRNRLKLVRLEY